MAAKESKANQARNELARALARWDNEGGAVQLTGSGQPTLGEVEEGILQCLGAAVIVQWNDLPAEIQRQLFQQAVSVGEPRYASHLKERIARFLHDHKDDNPISGARQ